MHLFTSSRLQCAATYPPPQFIGERNCGSYNHYTTSTRSSSISISIIAESMTSVFNSDSSLAYNQESLIVKKRIKMDEEGT
ncbi:hypothetical protein T265_11172 [Opisthorchis viverrini]|uniref:Uncharacterized protein n=1 Tax=Opisthorchis viverrini TaxID=6198 RepID=A0A074Z402_OPIVI|nr:hypothetical protein T265_11172 [Opisthorchis viverrini]KER20232.1 hypothetical protein T265_11172 [Opisthorchis viverrini]